MFKKLIALMKSLKKESGSATINSYEKKYGSYTAGYRHKEI